MSNTLFSTLYDEIRLEVPGCPDQLIEMALVRAARDICSRAQVWRHKSYVWPVPGTECYGLDYPADSTLGDIVAVTYLDKMIYPINEKTLNDGGDYWRTCTGGAVTHFFQPEIGTIRLYPIPDASVNQKDSIAVDMSLIPLKTATGLARDIFDRHERLLVAGALGFLLSRREQRWSDPQMAGMHMGVYEAGVTNAKIDVIKSYTPSELQVQQRPFA